MAAVSWKSTGIDGQARAGNLTTPHGTITTPAFMPVGTRAAVKAVDSDDLRDAGAEIILSNTYHLMLRPGADLVAEMGGLHGFMSWDGPILTDSGGYQIFSLDPKISEDGATFKSVYDGSRVHLTPEEAVAVQERLGPDIAMVLDVCVGLPAPRDEVEGQMHRTLRWAERCLDAHNRSDQELFGIIQGGVDPELRSESAERTAALGFSGFGIGGLSVGESAEERNTALDATMRHLPSDRPRYVMGLGDTEGLLEAIERGADMFDCVIPTRLARHGKVLTTKGDFNINQKRFETDDSPIDPECDCRTCDLYSKSYLRHLIRMNELSSHRLLTIHNLKYTLDLIREAGRAIERGEYGAFKKRVEVGRSEDSQ